MRIHKAVGRLLLHGADMKSDFEEQEKMLHRRIGEVLHYVWDPIGVAAVPQARDEYDSYIAPVFALLNAGASEAEICTYLDRLATDWMGLGDTLLLSKKAASVLVNWRDFATELTR